MRVSFPRLPFFQMVALLFLVTGQLSFAQQSVRVGLIATGSSGTVSDPEIRNQLVNAINQSKTGKKFGLALEAVGLEASAGNKVMAEAAAKNCQFVVSVQMRALESSYTYDPALSGSMGESREGRAAILEYQIIRVKDEMSYAIGTVKGQGVSDRAAISQAATKLADQLLTELRKNNGEFGAGSDPASSRLSATGTNFCAWLPNDIPHAEALRGVCEYANALPRTMPNFMCQQQTSRYDGASHIATDLIIATVRYEDGKESYSGLKRNGNPMPDSMWRNAGLWSSGQFGGSLRAIFHASNRAQFIYSGENQFAGHAVWVFTYKVQKQNEPLWELRGGNEVLAPPYSGDLWVDQQSGAILRFGSVAHSIPDSFPLREAAVQIDFSKVDFGDGTSFVLPSEATIASKYEGYQATRNVAEFQGCHKFRATARMVTNVASGFTDASASESVFAETRRELEQNNELYEILRQEAIRQDEAYIESEHRSDLNAATVEAFWRLASLRKELAKKLPAERGEKEVSAASDAVATFKVRSNLVLVSVVLRDAKGHTVGSLTKNDFHLFDDRRPQSISSFSLESTGKEGDNSASTADPTETSGKRLPATENSIALVFDDLHADLEQLEAAKTAAEHHLADMSLTDRVALFATSGQAAVEFTSDREELLVALRSLKPRARGEGENCPPMSYYEADLIVNQGDGSAMDLATQDALTCSFVGSKGNTDRAQINIAARTARAKAFQLATDGKIESETTLQVLKNAIVKVGARPGRRSVVLVSAGVPVLTVEDQAKAASLIEQALQAGVIVNTLDDSGLPASIGSTASSTGAFADRIQMASGEAQARTGVLADLAYGTGGTFFHNNNDMNEGFRRTAEMPEFIYVLGFSPQKLDGKFHRLKVALNSQQKLTVQARPGYYALKPEASP